MGKISRSDERSEKADVHPGYCADRLFKNAFLSLRNLLIISSLFTFIYCQNAKAQISNELAFDSMVVGYCQGKADELSKVTGFLTEGLTEKLKSKLKGEDSLKIEQPEIEFKKLDGDEIERKIEVNLMVDQETGEMENLVYRDTLDRKSLRKIRSTKYPELKGEHPGTFRRFVLPSIALAAGVGTIVSLFYIRSR